MLHVRISQGIELRKRQRMIVRTKRVSSYFDVASPSVDKTSAMARGKKQRELTVW